MITAMMRLLIFPLGIALVVVTIYLSYASFVADTRHTTELTPLYPSPIFIVNTSDNSAPLFSSKTPHAPAIGKLKPGEFYRFAYAGSTGTWLYGNRVFIKNEKRVKAILVRQKPIALEYLKMVYIIGVAVLFLMLATILKKKISNRQKHQLQLNSLASAVNQERQLRIRTESSLTENNKHIKELNHTIQRQKLALASKDAEIERQKKRSLDEMVAQFKQKERQLKQQFEDDAKQREAESKLRARVEISQMERSYETLNNKYLTVKTDFARIKAEGLTFDIGFDDENYDILLKGRLYEICFAKNLLNDPDFEILTWVSDKGFKNGIRVKSNGDPDFLIQYKRKHALAVECKYRSKTFKTEEPREITWCNSE